MKPQIEQPMIPDTVPSFTPEKRNAIIELLAHRFLDRMSGRDLEWFFLDAQLDYLKSYSDQELEAEFEVYGIDEEELSEFISTN